MQRAHQATAFDWHVMASGTPRYWRLAWALVAEQTARLADDAIVPTDRSERADVWTPALELALSEPTDRSMVDSGYVPGRQVISLADGRISRHLHPGIRLCLLAAIPDMYHEGLGTNFWRLEDKRECDVPYVHSALEGRWGGAAVVADRVIVRADHPFLGDAARAGRLLADLRAITRDFRRRNGLPPDGALEQSSNDGDEAAGQSGLIG